MVAKLNWSEIQSADYGTENPSSFTLSLENVKLLLLLLNDRAVYRGAWVVGTSPPTNSEWDDIQEFVSGAINALFYGGSNGMEVCILEDQKTAGTDGGAFTSGAWRVRDLNTEVIDDIGVTLSSDEFVLTAGKYFISMSLLAFRVNGHRGRLWNVTDGAIAISGQNTNNNSANYGATPAVVSGVVDIATSKTFRAEHQCQTTKTVNGFGINMNGYFTVPYEVYSQVIIRKL